MNQLTNQIVTDLLRQASIPARLIKSLRFTMEAMSDWEDRDFIAIFNKAHTEGVLIAPLDTVFAVPFQLNKRPANAAGRIEPIVCDFCATWQQGSNSANIRFQKTHSSVNYLVCADLQCSLHVRDKTDEAKLSRMQLREVITKEKRIERLCERLQARLIQVT